MMTQNILLGRHDPSVGLDDFREQSSLSPTVGGMASPWDQI